MDRIGLTWPNALPVTIYAQILLSARPEEECSVPVATMDTDADPIFSGIRPRPGAIFLLRRKWWEGKSSRKGQTRGRLEDGVFGGWNMSSSTHPAVRSVVGDSQSRKLLVDYLSRRKGEDATAAAGDDGYQSDTVPISAGLKRHEIFMVPSAYDASVPPAVRQSLPSICLVHYVQDDVVPDPRVMLPRPPIMMLHQTSGRGTPRLMPPDKTSRGGRSASRAAPAAAIAPAATVPAAIVQSVAPASRAAGGPEQSRDAPPPARPYSLFPVASTGQPRTVRVPAQPQYPAAAWPVNQPNPAGLGQATYSLAPAAASPSQRSAYPPTSFFLANSAQQPIQAQQWPVPLSQASPQYSSDHATGIGSSPDAQEQAWPRQERAMPSSLRATPEWMLPSAKRQRNALPLADLEWHRSLASPSSLQRQQAFEQTVNLTTSTNSVLSQGQVDAAIMQVLEASTGSTSNRAECGLRYEDALHADFMDADDLLDSFTGCLGSPAAGRAAPPAQL